MSWTLHCAMCRTQQRQGETLKVKQRTEITQEGKTSRTAHVTAAITKARGSRRTIQSAEKTNFYFYIQLNYTSKVYLYFKKTDIFGQRPKKLVIKQALAERNTKDTP